MAPAATLEAWVEELRDAFDRGRRDYAGLAPARGCARSDPADAACARETAEELGRRAGAFEAAHGAQGKAFADEARRRFFPPLDKAGWARVVLASAVRAYVPLVDPHGEWAPFDEESRIYEVDLASRPPSRLWGRAVPTAVGVRVTESADAAARGRRRRALGRERRDGGPAARAGRSARLRVERREDAAVGRRPPRRQDRRRSRSAQKEDAGALRARGRELPSSASRSATATRSSSR